MHLRDLVLTQGFISNSEVYLLKSSIQVEIKNPRKLGTKLLPKNNACLKMLLESAQWGSGSFLVIQKFTPGHWIAGIT